MTEPCNQDLRTRQEQAAQEAEHLAAEVKLLAINLAVILAQLRNRELTLEVLQAEFAELIEKAHHVSQQVSDVAQAFHHRKRILWSLPSSSEVIRARGAYDAVEVALNQVSDLSAQLTARIKALQKGRPAP